MALISNTGMRLSEVTGLARKDIVLDADIPHVLIRPHLWRRLKTKGSEMDTVPGCIEDECHKDPSHSLCVANLYEQYASWCKAQDKHPRTKVQFGTALKSQGYAQVRDSTGRYWQGLTTLVVA